VCNKLRMERVVFWLWTLAKRQGEIDLARFPLVGCRKQHTHTNSGPSYEWAACDAVMLLKVTSAAKSALEFAQLSIWKPLDSLHPSAWDDLGSFWNAGSRDNSQGVLAFKACNFSIHCTPEFFSMRTGE